MKRLQLQLKAGSTRDGFGEGLLAAAARNKRIVVLTADLAESTRVEAFAKKYPDRFYDVGVAEQNLVTMAAGLAHVGKIPVVTSFAVFCPGRCWEQIRTTICYNDQPVKIVGSHAGLGVGEDGATHQMLEDIALMRVLPNMTVIVPCDEHQAAQATEAMIHQEGPCYLRVTRQSTTTVSTGRSFILGKGQVFLPGVDATLFVSGTLLPQVLAAAQLLRRQQLQVAVINIHTIKPLDVGLVVGWALKTKRVVTIEDHQRMGGLGSAIAECLTASCPVPLLRLGVDDVFGESATPEELYRKHGLDADSIAKHVAQWVSRQRR